MDDTIKNLQNEISTLTKGIEEYTVLLSNETNTEMKTLYQQEIGSLQAQKSDLEKTVSNLLTTDYIDNNEGEPTDNINPNTAILEIRAGAGGDEAGLFGLDLYRMYARFAEKKGWKMTQTFVNENESGGIKTTTADIRGLNVYNLLKHESGVHRVQRVPVTEAGGRIHTSTATVAILPVMKKVTIEIKPDDLHWEFFRAGGHGGQNVNKVSTAVRLTHVPTNTVIECQEERFQNKNREKALGVLQSKLYSMMQEQHVKTITDLRTNQVGTGDRSEKIRTYNYPQDRVTDHRIGKNWHNIANIMLGNIDQILLDCSIELQELPQE